MTTWQRIPGDANARDVVRAVVVLVVAVPGYFEPVQTGLQGDAPAAAVREMCADELIQDYAAVYALLSPSFIQQYGLNQAKLVQAQQGRDQGFGLVVACAIVGRDYGLSLWNTGAVFQVTITLNDGSTPYTDTGPIELVDDHGGKISSEGIDAALYFAG